MPTVLVLGANGMVGSKLIDLLRQDCDITVVAGTRSVPSEPDLEWRKVDINNRASVQAALKGIELVFLCTGLSRPSFSSQFDPSEFC